MENKIESVQLFVGGKTVEGVPFEIPIDDFSSKQEKFTYYLRKGNRFYFKNERKKLFIDVENPIDDLKKIKYNTEVLINYA